MKKNELSCKELMIGDCVMVYPWDETPWEPKKITDINFHSWEGTDFCDSVGVEGWPHSCYLKFTTLDKKDLHEVQQFMSRYEKSHIDAAPDIEHHFNRDWLYC